MSDFRETVARLRETLHSDIIYQVFNGRQVEDFCSTVDIMESHINKAMKDEEIKPEKEEIGKVEQGLRYIERAVILECIPAAVRSFIESYTLLAFNWNRLACSDEIAQGVAAVKHLLSYHESMVETTRVLKRLLQEARGVMEFRPPAFELSRHYLQAIQEKLEGGAEDAVQS